jgi:hypothetical protein
MPLGLLMPNQAVVTHPFPKVMGTPTVLTTTTTNPSLAVPAGAVVGERLLVVAAAFTAISMPAGWNTVAYLATSSEAIGVYERTVDGTEGASITVTISGTGGKYLSMERYVNINTAAGSIVGVTTNGTTDPANITPSWGLANTRWLAMGGLRNTGGASSFTWPSDYTLDRRTSVAGSNGQEDFAYCAKNARVASSDPSDFLFTGGVYGTPAAMAVAMRPK